MQIHSNSQNQVLKLILTVIISLFYVLGYSQSCATFDWSDYKTGPNGLGQWPSTSLNNTYINDGVNFEYLVDPPPGGLATFLPVVGPLYEGGLGSVDDQLILAASAGNIDGNSIVVEIDMGVPGIGLENVGLTLFDIDGGNNGSTVMYGEQVTITGEISGTTVSPTITGTSIHTISGNTVTADETDSPNTGTNSGDGNVDVEFNSAVDKVRIEFTLAPGADFVSGSEPGFSVYNLDYCPPDISIELTDGSCWRTMTSPVAGETYQDFFARFRTNNTDYGGLWTQGATGARFTGGDPNVFTLNSDGSDWVAVGDLTQSIPPGTGFLISVFDEDDFNNPSSSGFNKIATIDGSDVENSSAVTVDLGTPSGTTASGGQDDPNFQGFSMMGNPFKSTIDFSQVLANTGTTGIESAAWVYDRGKNPDDSNLNAGATGGWISTNGTIGDITNGLIAPGQGFVVQNVESPSGTPSVTFPETAKTTGGTFVGKRAVKTLPDHIRFEVRGESVYNSAWVQFSQDGHTTESIDGDVQQFYPFESEYAVLSTVKQGQLFDIGHFPAPVSGDADLRIPLTIETTTTAPVTLELTDLQLPGTTLYLHDTVTGESIELTEGVEYNFTPSGTPAKSLNHCLSAPNGFLGPQLQAKDAGPRFYISTEASTGSVGPELPNEYGLQQNYPNPFNPTTQITYELPQQSDVRLEVFDMSGRQIVTLVNESVSAGTHTVNFDASSLSSGVYLYKLQVGSTVLTRKLTLIK